MTPPPARCATSSRSSRARSGIYICGPPCRRAPHIGHIRSAVDLRRPAPLAAPRRGYDVTLVRNVTDIDDKILAKAADAGPAVVGLAPTPTSARSPRRYDALGVLPPTYEPRATGHVPEMIELMRGSSTSGHAYAADDGSGDVYFDVRSLADVRRADRPAGRRHGGRRRTPTRAASATRATSRCGRARKPGEPETAAGRRPVGAAAGPGWHLECSAMAQQVPRRRVRHPRRRRSTCASRTTRTSWPSRGPPATGSRSTGCTTRWVTIGGEKMSKSLGNSLLVTRGARAEVRGRSSCATT